MALYSTESAKIVLVILAVIATPLASGLIAGLVHRMRLRQQGEREPSILQPFVDFRQMFRQQPGSANDTAMLAVLLQLAFAMVSLLLLVLGRNLLAALALQLFSGLVAIVAAGNRNPGFIDQQRLNPLKQYLTYQPVVLLAAAGCGLVAGSFGVDAMLGQNRPLIVELPLVWLSLLYAAHVFSGVATEADLAGPVLAVARLAGCFRQAGLLLFAGLFAADSLIMAGLIAILLGYGLFAAECMANRFYCRVMAIWGWRLIYFACAINLTWIYIKYQ